jgi:hypothetical protein
MLGYLEVSSSKSISPSFLNSTSYKVSGHRQNVDKFFAGKNTNGL